MSEIELSATVAGLKYKVTQEFQPDSMKSFYDDKFLNKLTIKEGDQVILDTFWYGHEREWYLKRKAEDEVRWVSENKDVLEATGDKSFSAFTCPRCRTTLKLTNTDFKELRQINTYQKECPWCNDYVDVFPVKKLVYTSKAGNTISYSAYSPLADNQAELERLADRTPEEKERDDEINRKLIADNCKGW